MDGGITELKEILKENFRTMEENYRSLERLEENSRTSEEKSRSLEMRLEGN